MGLSGTGAGDGGLSGTGAGDEGLSGTGAGDEGVTAEHAVNELIAGCVTKDLARVAAVCADDMEYDNVPMGKVFGRDEIIARLTPMVERSETIEWIVHRQVASDTTVMNERSDRFLIGGKWIDLPVMGVFEVVDGKITLWRDYFDLESYRSQMSA
jgi:limonene-1,2-epoxide hydrolase